MSQTVLACPSCDSSNINHRFTKEPFYRCAACGHEFETAISREMKASGHGEGKVEACPFCNDCRISERKTQKPKFLCLKCHQEFAEPRERGPKGSQTPPSEELEGLNPEDVGLSKEGERGSD